MGKTKKQGIELTAEVVPLIKPLIALQRLITRFNDQGVVIGGLATSFLGKPRLTADLDAMVLLDEESIPDFILAAKHEGIVGRIKDVEDFAQKHHVFLFYHQESGMPIDITIGRLPFEREIVERSHEYQAGSISIRLPTPEDLIILKAIANRPKDLMDIQSIIASHPHLDKQRVEYWVKQFAEALDAPELWTDIAKWLV